MQGNISHTNRRIRCKCQYLLLSFFSFLLLIVWTALLVSLIKDKAIPILQRMDYTKTYDIKSYSLSIEEYKKAYPGLEYSKLDLASIREKIHIELFKLGDLLTQWNPDDVSIDKWEKSLAHPNRGKGIPRFDYSNEDERNVAMSYRQAELPFVLYNNPIVESSINTYFTMDALSKNFGDKLLMVDRSVNYNHFTYYKDNHIREYKRTNPSYTPPQEPIEMKFSDYLYLCDEAEKLGPIVNNTLHYYTISAHNVSYNFHSRLSSFGYPEYFRATNSNGYVKHFHFLNEKNRFSSLILMDLKESIVGLVRKE